MLRILLFSKQIDATRLTWTGAPELIGIAHISPVPHNAAAESLVVQGRLDAGAQLLGIFRAHHHYLAVLEAVLAAHLPQHILKLVAAAENQHVSLHTVALLAPAVLPGDIVEHVREGRNGKRIKEQYAAEGNNQAEDIVPFQRETARVQIQIENIRPLQRPDAAHEAEHGKQCNHQSRQPSQLPSFALREEPVNFASQHICLLLYREYHPNPCPHNPLPPFRQARTLAQNSVSTA